MLQHPKQNKQTKNPEESICPSLEKSPADFLQQRFPQRLPWAQTGGIGCLVLRFLSSSPTAPLPMDGSKEKPQALSLLPPLLPPAPCPPEVPQLRQWSLRANGSKQNPRIVFALPTRQQNYDVQNLTTQGLPWSIKVAHVPLCPQATSLG